MKLYKLPEGVSDEDVYAKLGEDRKRMENYIKLMVDWMKRQKHLPDSYDKSILPVYIRGSRYNLEKAKEKLECYFVSRAQYPEIFTDFDLKSEELRRVQKYFKVAVLPRLTAQLNLVVFCRGDNYDPEFFKLEPVIKFSLLIVDVLLSQRTPFVGAIYIMDEKHFQPAVLPQLLTKLSKTMLKLSQEAYPNLLQSVHFINVSSFAVTAVNLLKNFMTDKLKNKIHIHETHHGLREFIGGDLLPVEYGGKNKSLDELSDEFYAYLDTKSEYLRRNASAKCVGGIPAKYRTRVTDDGGAVDGAFRKLDID